MSDWSLAALRESYRFDGSERPALVPISTGAGCGIGDAEEAGYERLTRAVAAVPAYSEREAALAARERRCAYFAACLLCVTVALAVAVLAWVWRVWG